MRTLTSERTAEIFREAAQLIEKHGFTQHDRDRVSGLTLDSALCEVIHPLAEETEWTDQHPLDCEEACDRLLGWMLLAGVTYPRSWGSSGSVIGSWSDERGRTGQMAAGLLERAAEALEAVYGDPLGDKIRECWKQSQRDVRQLRDRNARGGLRMIYDRLTGMALAWRLLHGREPVHLTHVMHDVHDQARSELGIDLDEINGWF